MSMLDKPNVSLPLAASYNERGIKGFASTVTNALDQRKINSIYEPIKNALTGQTTLYLVKRPGVVDTGNTYGTSGQVAYLIEIAPGATEISASNFWVFSTSGNDIRASNSSGTTTVIATAAGYKPVFVDKTAISGADTLVVQLRNASNAQRIFFSTAIATFTEITDSDLTSLTLVGKMQFMDGYAFIMDSLNRIYNSDLNSLANWTASNYITKQIVQDVGTGLIKHKNQILAFGRGSFEVFVNAGSPTGSPLVSVPSLAGHVGLYDSGASAKNYSCRIDEKTYFVGLRPSGLYVWNGQSAVMVSTPAINKIIADSIVYSVTQITFYGNTAVSLVLTADTETTQRALMYFPVWNDWFEWTSTVFKPWGLPVGASNFLGVDQNQHKVYNIPGTIDNWQDAGTNYTWTHQFQLPANGNDRKVMHYMGLKGDTARSAQTISVEFSDDDYQTFSTARTINMTTARKSLTRCGSWEGQRAVRLSYTGANSVRLEKFLARIE